MGVHVATTLQSALTLPMEGLVPRSVYFWMCKYRFATRRYISLRSSYERSKDESDGEGNDTTGHNWRKDRRQMIEAWPGRGASHRAASAILRMHTGSIEPTYLEYSEKRYRKVVQFLNVPATERDTFPIMIFGTFPISDERICIQRTSTSDSFETNSCIRSNIFENH